jgi:ABC-type uncharacterized transport system YnjBCD ATPase subunit
MMYWLWFGSDRVLASEEEIGSEHLAAFVARHADRLRADGCVWEAGYKDAAGRPTISLGLKGICYVELRVRAAKKDAHSSLGAIVPNAAWRLVWALATLKDERDRITVDGRVCLDTTSGVDVPPQQRRLGYVFQGYALFPHLTVADNVGFGLRDRPRRERDRRVADVLARLGLAGLEQPHAFRNRLRARGARRACACGRSSG